MRHSTDTTKLSTVLKITDNAGKLVRSRVVFFAGHISIGSQRSCRHSNEELGFRTLCRGNEGCPVIVVEWRVLTQTQRTGRIVIELNPKIVECIICNDHLHVRLRQGALRRAGNEVGVTVIRSKVGADLGDQARIVLATLVYFEIKVESVHKHIAKGPLHRVIARVAIRIPQELADLLSVGS